MTNQWVNSYKRLVPGFEAPVFISWGRHNRSSLIRIPMYKPNKPSSTRIEYRAPDPACNPYLAFAVMLAAGLQGIEKGYELPPEAKDNIYEMSDAERRAAGIRSLPRTSTRRSPRWRTPSSWPAPSASTSSTSSCATSAPSGTPTAPRSPPTSSALPPDAVAHPDHTKISAIGTTNSNTTKAASRCRDISTRRAIPRQPRRKVG